MITDQDLQSRGFEQVRPGLWRFRDGYSLSLFVDIDGREVTARVELDAKRIVGMESVLIDSIAVPMTFPLGIAADLDYLKSCIWALRKP